MLGEKNIKRLLLVRRKYKYYINTVLLKRDVDLTFLLAQWLTVKTKQSESAGRGLLSDISRGKIHLDNGLVFVKPNPNQLLPPERSGGGAFSKASNKQGILCRGDEQPDVPFSRVTLWPPPSLSGHWIARSNRKDIFAPVMMTRTVEWPEPLFSHDRLKRVGQR